MTIKWKNIYNNNNLNDYNEIKHNIHYINLKNENFDLKKEIEKLKKEITVNEKYYKNYIDMYRNKFKDCRNRLNELLKI